MVGKVKMKRDRSLHKLLISTVCCFLFLQFLAPSLYAVDEREILMEEAKDLSWNKDCESAKAVYKKILEKIRVMLKRPSHMREWFHGAGIMMRL